MENEFIAACPISVMMSLDGKWEKHPCIFQITKKGTVGFKCSYCKMWGYINSPAAVKDVKEELVKYGKLVLPPRKESQSGREATAGEEAGDKATGSDGTDTTPRAAG